MGELLLTFVWALTQEVTQEFMLTVSNKVEQMLLSGSLMKYYMVLTSNKT